MLLEKANGLLDTWVDIEIETSDAEETAIVSGYLETVAEQGITISNNQPPTGNLHDTCFQPWSKIVDIRPAEKPGEFEC